MGIASLLLRLVVVSLECTVSSDTSALWPALFTLLLFLLTGVDIGEFELTVAEDVEVGPEVDEVVLLLPAVSVDTVELFPTEVVSEVRTVVALLILIDFELCRDDSPLIPLFSRCWKGIAMGESMVGGFVSSSVVVFLLTDMCFASR